jgi:hypothetical protein
MNKVMEKIKQSHKLFNFYDDNFREVWLKIKIAEKVNLSHDEMKKLLLKT